MTKPLYMWAGGKSRMLKKYADLLGEVSFDKYIEPFFGGGAMFIWAYEKNPKAEFIINDINSGIMNIYSAIKNDYDQFVEVMDVLSKEYLPLPKGETDKKLEKDYDKDWDQLYRLHPCRRYFYFNLRQKHAYSYEQWGSTKEAAVLYFLMKTGFNGLWQENKNTNGRFGTPAGLLNQKDKVYDKEVVEWWHNALQNCTILNDDFGAVKHRIDANTFLFMDPPYRDSFTQYETDFNDDEQRRVISLLKECKSQGGTGWMSNREAGDGFFEDHAADFEMHKFPVTYTAGRRKKVADGFEAKKATEILLVTK